MALSFAALVLFSVNEFYVLAGWGALNLSGPAGAAALMGFLGIGLVVQTAKFIEGHNSKVDALVTFTMFPLHIAAALTIWFRTQINHSGLPSELPLYLVGVYWVIGLLEIVARYIGRELKLFKRDYESPEIKLMKAQQEIALLEERNRTERTQREAAERREERAIITPRQLSAPVSGKRSRTPQTNNDPEQIVARIREQLAATPDMAKVDMVDALGMSKSTFYKYLPAAQNGHRKEAAN
jgi:hypothetical protein